MLRIFSWAGASDERRRDVAAAARMAAVLAVSSEATEETRSIVGGLPERLSAILSSRPSGSLGAESSFWGAALGIDDGFGGVVFERAAALDDVGEVGDGFGDLAEAALEDGELCGGFVGVVHGSD